MLQGRNYDRKFRPSHTLRAIELRSFPLVLRGSEATEEKWDGTARIMNRLKKSVVALPVFLGSNSVCSIRAREVRTMGL